MFWPQCVPRARGVRAGLHGPISRLSSTPRQTGSEQKGCRRLTRNPGKPKALRLVDPAGLVGPAVQLVSGNGGSGHEWKSEGLEATAAPPPPADLQDTVPMLAKTACEGARARAGLRVLSSLPSVRSQRGPAPTPPHDPSMAPRLPSGALG
ncbi:hypothetical protein TREES_T100017315 [Tupaia chinensis]|uniref:Uncharacterized protein n=1 Tax=Tupaia chinensis TaxID=246437 RepID=L9JFM0_TUPCH|nr:hypothetical protein TREES_T100017315 [Tupaia chinensis]